MSEQPETHSYKSIRGHMARGAAWMIGARWAIRIIGMVNIVIAARLLVPEDFGVVAMGAIVVGFLQSISDTNVGTALVRAKELTRAHYDSAWTVKVITGLVTMVAIMAAAPYMADYYGDERVELVTQIVALRAGFLAFENIGIIDFRRDLNFRRDFLYWVYRRAALFVFGLGLILLLRNYMALALAAPLTGIIAVALSYKMSPYRPRWCTSKIGEMWRFSQWIILLNISGFVAKRTDEFIIAGSGGAAVLGAYHVAAEVSSMPTREFVMPTVRALTPTYSKIAHDPEAIRSAYRGVLKYVALICCAFGIGAAVVAEDFVVVLLGDKWSDAVPVFRWLAIYGALSGLYITARPLLLALGRERVLSIAAMLYAATLVPIIVYIGSTQGVEEIAAARTGARLIALLGMFWVMTRITGVRLRDVAAAIWRPLSAGLAMAYAVLTLHDASIASPIVSLLRDTTVGGVVFVAITYSLWFLVGRPGGPERTAPLVVYRHFRQQIHSFASRRP